MAANPPAIPNPFARGAALLASKPQQPQIRQADVVLAIDASASMAPLWKLLKQDAALLPDIMDNACVRAGLESTDVRLRFIAFRDLYMQDAAFACSPFFSFPGDVQQARDFIASVKPGGHGGPCTSGLEALLIALHSPWKRENGMRHRIAIITDSSAYLLDEPLRKFDQHYDSILGHHLPDPAQTVPGELNGLRRMWRDGVGTIDNWNSRIMLYTVGQNPWLQMIPWPRITPRQAEATQLHSLQLPTLLDDIFSTL